MRFWDARGEEGICSRPLFPTASGIPEPDSVYDAPHGVDFSFMSTLKNVIRAAPAGTGRRVELEGRAMIRATTVFRHALCSGGNRATSLRSVKGGRA
jgi:hypothetical protein